MKHKNTFLSLCLVMLGSCPAFAQAKNDKTADQPDYQFTTVKELPITSIKDQYRSGTCWCFSTLSFLESELIRTQKKEVDLSEMWIVSHSYSDRASTYVRMDGKLGFSAGSGLGDVIETIKKYGITTQDAYSGMQYGTEKPEQAELDAVLLAYVRAVVSRPGKVLSTAWKKGFDAVLQAYMGQWPTEFKYEGKTMTPTQFRDEVLKFDATQYVNICSFMDAPYYQMTPIQVCDNWRNAGGYNVPMDDMIRIMYNALDNGYTVLWGGDVSEKGFTRNGIGVMPVEKSKKKDLEGTDQANWTGKDDAKADEKKDAAQADEKASEKPVVEIPQEVEVSDSLRLSAYERKMTTDDHGMHIFGYATDQNGTKYFKVKNSWGETGKYKGIWYLSETYVAYKTLNFMVHKDALPKDIKKKFGIK